MNRFIINEYFKQDSHRLPHSCAGARSLQSLLLRRESLLIPGEQAAHFAGECVLHPSRHFHPDPNRVQVDPVAGPMDHTHRGLHHRLLPVQNHPDYYLDGLSARLPGGGVRTSLLSVLIVSKKPRKRDGQLELVHHSGKEFGGGGLDVAVGEVHVESEVIWSI
jgi:hypothetical protein